MASNATGVLLNLAALVLFIIALRKYFRPRGLLIATTFLALSFEITVYGRLPLAENGMLFLMALTFVALTSWFETAWGKVLVGILVALCGLLGKSFGFLMAAGPVVYLIVHRKRGSLKELALEIGQFLIPLVVFSALYLLMTQGQGNYFAFLWEHGAKEHGPLKGFRSIKDYFESLISFPRTGLHLYAPVVSVLAYVTTFRLVVGGKWGESASKLLTFMLSWIVTWVIILSPSDYLPTRYLFVLVVPISILAALLLDNLSRVDLPPVRFRSVWRIILLELLNWYTCFVVIQLFLPDPFKSDLYLRAVWYAFSPSLILTLLQILIIRAWRFMIPVRWHRAVIAACLIIFMLAEGRQYLEWYRSRTHTLSEASDDLPAIVAPNAVIAGQYGPALTSNGVLQGFPYFLTPDIPGMLELFRQYPVTHIAVSASEWNPLCQRYPQLKQAPVVTTYWLRDNVVYLVRIANVTGNATPAQYQESTYERGMDYERAGLLDSAQVAFAAFLRDHPLSKAGLTEKYFVDLSQAADRDLTPEKPLVDSLLAHYGTDFSVCVLGSSYYKWLAESTGSQEDRNRSLAYLEDAIVHNRRNEKNLRERYAGFRPGTRVLH